MTKNYFKTLHSRDCENQKVEITRTFKARLNGEDIIFTEGIKFILVGKNP